MFELVVSLSVLGVLSAGTPSAPADVIPLGDCSSGATGVVPVIAVDYTPGDSAGAPCAGRLVLPQPGPLELEPVPKAVRRL